MASSKGGTRVRARSFKSVRRTIYCRTGVEFAGQGDAACAGAAVIGAGAAAAVGLGRAAAGFFVAGFLAGFLAT